MSTLRAPAWRILLAPGTLLGIALLSLLLVLPWILTIQESSPYQLEVRLTSSVDGHAQVFYDIGRGMSEADSSRQPIEASTTGKIYRFALPLGSYRSLRLDPLDREGVVTYSGMRIIGLGDKVFRTFSPNDIIPTNQIASVQIVGDAVKVTTIQGSTDPNTGVSLEPPLALYPARSGRALKLSRYFGTAFLAVATVVFFLAALLKRINESRSPMLTWLADRPAMSVTAVAVMAVTVSCYPVVFFGKSFASPNYGTTLLYERFPTLPGYTSAVTEDQRASDVGALIWQHLPYSMMQHQAVVRDHELPLWNRYNASGTALLGQGQSMFGDPIHLLVIAADGASWAWDIKYLIAKWLLACGLGLLVFHGTRHLPASLLTAFSAPFIGFFLFRLNHPAIFGFCYAPWVLYCWARLISSASFRSTLRWCGGLFLASWTLMNSGTVKEAYTLLLFTHAAGFVYLLCGGLALRDALGKMALAAWTGFLLILVSSPIWMTFLHTLKTAYENSQGVGTAVFQIHPALLLGVFDEIFYRPLVEGEFVFNPSANFLILLGCLYALATYRRTATNTLKRGLVVALALQGTLLFGLIPPTWLAAVPFFARIGHTDNCFLLPFILQLTALAGFGYQAAWQRLGTAESRGDLAVVGVLLMAVLLPYLSLLHTVHRGVVSFVQWDRFINPSHFVWGDLLLMLIAGAGLLLTVRAALLCKAWSPLKILLCITCLTALLWRHGQQLTAQPFDNYVFNPTVRADLHARSPAITAIQQDRREPYRVIGLNGNLFPGWTVAYGLEGLSGPDALMNREYRDLLAACGLDRQWTWRIVAQEETTAALKRAYDFLNLKYYVDLPSTRANLGGVLRKLTSSDLDVFVSDGAWPRAFFTDRVALYQEPAELAALIAQGDGRPFAAIDAIDQKAAIGLSHDLGSRTSIPAKDYHLTSNTTSFEVTTPGPGLVVLHESWLRDDFRVEVNGTPAECLRVNHAFKGVRISEAGSHKITFRYLPAHFHLALTLSAIGLALGLVTAAVGLRFRSRQLVTT